MPLQELSPLPQVSGYGALGNALAQASGRFADQSRQDLLLARAREQLLADVASNRAEGDRTYARARGNQLTDMATVRANQLADVADVRTESDRTHNRARGEQLEDRDEGRQYSESQTYLENARKLKERAPFEQNLQQYVNYAAERLHKIQGEAEAITRIINTAAPEIDESSPEILNKAAALAQQQLGRHPSKEEILQSVPEVTKGLAARAYLEHQQRLADGRATLQNLIQERKELTDIIQVGVTKNVSPSTLPPAGPAAPSTFAPPSRGTAQPLTAAGLSDALNKAIRAPAQQASGPSGASVLIDNPTANPVIDRGNAALQQQQELANQSEINSTIAEIKRYQDLLAGAASPVSSAPVGAMGGIVPYRAPDPVVQAQQTSSWLKAQAMAEQKLKQLQARKNGGASAATVAPAINTSTSSTPAGFEPPDWQQSSPPLWD